MRPNALLSCCVVLLIAGILGCSTEPSKTDDEKLQANELDLSDTLRSTVKDTDRLRQMLALVDQLTAELQVGLDELAKLREEEALLNADYNASLEELHKVGDRIQSVRVEYRAKLIRMRMALAQLATDDEWKKITSRDLAISNN